MDFHSDFLTETSNFDEDLKIPRLGKFAWGKTKIMSKLHLIWLSSACLVVWKHKVKASSYEYILQARNRKIA